MTDLLKGVETFQQQQFPAQRELFEQLATSQRPVALIITCSDSRIDPNLITQTKPGEIFVLRNAGNLVPRYDALNGGESATIEYAVAVLNIKQIIVCGHSDCGAMKALLKGEGLDALPAVAAWLKHAEPVRTQLLAQSNTSDQQALVNELIEQNVLAQLDNLRTHPAVAAKLASNELQLTGWVYQIHTGRVLVHDQQQGRFVSATKEISTAA